MHLPGLQWCCNNNNPTCTSTSSSELQQCTCHICGGAATMLSPATTPIRSATTLSPAHPAALAQPHPPRADWRPAWSLHFAGPYPVHDDRIAGTQSRQSRRLTAGQGS
eukprot:1162036-Pelagomonas_calceolata.AAC.3